jgi:hypothetical protein
LSHSPGGGSQTTHLVVDRNPSTAAHPGPSAIVPPPTHRCAAHTVAPGAPPSTGVGSGDSTSVSDLPEVWSALSSMMHCPTAAALEIHFVVTNEVCDALPKHAVAGSHQASCPRTSYSTSIWSGSGCMAARRRHHRRVEACGTVVAAWC